jgi:hypothetical protein
LLGDRAYDDGKLLDKLWTGNGVKPVIDIRNCWKDNEETRLVKRPKQRNLCLQGRGLLLLPSDR